VLIFALFFGVLACPGSGRADGNHAFLTEMDSVHAEQTLVAETDFYLKVLSRYKELSQCQNVLVWDDEGRYTLAKDLRLAAYPFWLGGFATAFTWTLDTIGANRVKIARLIRIPYGDPKAVWKFTRLRRVSIGAGALTVGILLWAISSHIADGDKFVSADITLQRHFSELKDASEIRFRNAIRADLMSKGSLKAVSVDLAKMSCGD
jgi:hypothetical protein